MTNQEALKVLRIAYDELYLHDLTDEDLENYLRIGKGIVREAVREKNKRKKK